MFGWAEFASTLSPQVNKQRPDPFGSSPHLRPLSDRRLPDRLNFMDAKKLSTIDGGRFLREAFAKQQLLLFAKLELAQYSITHHGKRGDVAEKHFIDILEAYLPRRYSVSSGIVIDHKGKTSDQIDIIIYDRQFTPTLLDQHDHKYITAEAVYAIFEVKPTFNKEYLDYAAEKAESVRSLSRTSVPYMNGDKMFPAKPDIEIISGLIAQKMSWSDGFGTAFMSNHREYRDHQKIDCGLTADGHCFDVFSTDGCVFTNRGGNALICFFFKLLGKLQRTGTVPAVDWESYASQLSNE